MTDVSVTVAKPTFSDDQLALITDLVKIVRTFGVVPSGDEAKAWLANIIDQIDGYLTAVGYVGTAGADATIQDLFDPAHPDYLTPEATTHG